MARAPIDDNQHKAILTKNKISGSATPPTSRTLGTTEAQDVAIVDGSGNQLTSLAGLIPGTDYNYLDVQQTSATVETYVFKTGGSGGTTVRTITVTYTSSAKTDIDTVEWS